MSCVDRPTRRRLKPRDSSNGVRPARAENLRIKRVPPDRSMFRAGLKKDLTVLCLLFRRPVFALIGDALFNCSLLVRPQAHLR